MANLPILYKRAGSRYWYYSWYTQDGRERFSCRDFGLTVDIPEAKARSKVLEFLGISAPSPETGPETLSWFHEEILRRLEREGKGKSTIKEYRIALDHLLAVYGADYPLRQFRRADIGPLQDKLLKSAQSPTVNKILRHIRAAFQRLVDDEILERNPFRRFHALREPDRPRHLSKSEALDFLQSVESEPSEAIRRLIRLYLFTGRRRQEILSIRRDCIDLAAGTMRVTNVKSRTREMQSITIPQAVRPDVEWFLSQGKSPEPFRVCHPDFITRRVKRYLAASGHPDLHLHSLRHTFVTLALGNGVSIWDIKEWLGHSSVLVSEIYGHFTPEREIRLGIEETPAHSKANQ